MNDTEPNSVAPQIFYSSKLVVMQMTLNIAFAPILLYLFGAWAWPPTAPHYISFAITGLLGINYARQRWQAPRLRLDQSGLTCGKFYAAENIYRATPTMRSVTLTLLEDAKVKDKIISLGWASRADCQQIQQLLAARFQRELPDQR